MLPCVTYKLCVTDGRCHWDRNLNAKLSFSFPPAQHISASVCWCWAKKIQVFHMCRRSWRQNAKAPDHLVHYETLSQHDSDFMDLCLAVKVPLPVRCRSSGQPEWLVLGVCESLSLNGFSNILSPGCEDMSSGDSEAKSVRTSRCLCTAREFPTSPVKCVWQKRQEAENRGTLTVVLLQYFRTSDIRCIFTTVLQIHFNKALAG